MNLVRIGLMAAVVLSAGCWPFKGKRNDAPVPVLTNSPQAVDSLWREGEQAFNQGRWGRASQLFSQLNGVMPVTDARINRMAFYRGEIELARGNQLDAVRQFRRLADEHPDDSLAADALLRAGDAYSQLWKRPELDPTYGQTALAVYLEVQSRYPNSLASQRAEIKIRVLQDLFAQKDYLSAVFYIKYKAYDSAVLMLRDLIARYPRSSVVPAALERLVAAYRALKYEEDVQETCQYIVQFHPDPEGPRKLCPATVATDSTGQL